MKKVLVFGTFDGLHEGHLNLFRQAKEFGDFLIVVVARDSTVEKNKNKKPKFDENHRLKEVQALEIVSEARLGSESHNPAEDRYSIIEEIKPNVICLGYDQAQFVDRLKNELENMKIDAKIEVLESYKPEVYKSSLLNR